MAQRGCILPENIEKLHKKVGMKQSHWDHEGFAQQEAHRSDTARLGGGRADDAVSPRSCPAQDLAPSPGCTTPQSHAPSPGCTPPLPPPERPVQPRGAARGRARRRPDAQVYVPRGRRSGQQPEVEPDSNPDLQPDPSPEHLQDRQVNPECSANPEKTRTRRPRPPVEVYVPRHRREAQQPTAAQGCHDDDQGTRGTDLGESPVDGGADADAPREHSAKNKHSRDKERRIRRRSGESGDQGRERKPKQRRSREKCKETCEEDQNVSTPGQEAVSVGSGAAEESQERGDDVVDTWESLDVDNHHSPASIRHNEADEWREAPAIVPGESAVANLTRLAAGYEAVALPEPTTGVARELPDLTEYDEQFHDAMEDTSALEPHDQPLYHDGDSTTTTSAPSTSRCKALSAGLAGVSQSPVEPCDPTQEGMVTREEDVPPQVSQSVGPDCQGVAPPVRGHHPDLSAGDSQSGSGDDVEMTNLQEAASEPHHCGQGEGPRPPSPAQETVPKVDGEDYLSVAPELPAMCVAVHEDPGVEMQGAGDVAPGFLLSVRCDNPVSGGQAPSGEDNKHGSSEDPAGVSGVTAGVESAGVNGDTAPIPDQSAMDVADTGSLWEGTEYKDAMTSQQSESCEIVKPHPDTFSVHSPGLESERRDESVDPEGEDSQGSAAGAQNEADDNEDSWDALFDEEGEALDPKLLEELTVAVGSVEIEPTKLDYLAFQPKEPELDYDDYAHLIEIYDFSTELLTRDLMVAFKEFQDKGFDIKWVDDTHAIGVFSSSIAAHSALGMRHPLMKVRALSQATRQTKVKAKRSTEFLQPYKPRPTTVASVARNMVAGALGLKNHVTKEKREEERRKLREARDKRRQQKVDKKGAWEGTIGRCAMDEEG